MNVVIFKSVVSAMILCGTASLPGRAEDPAAAEFKLLGNAAIAAGQPEKAVEAFGKACSLDAKDPDACYFLGRTLHVLGRFEEARLPLEQALAVAPAQAKARTHRSIALNFAGLAQPDQAETHFLASLRFYSRDAAGEDPRVDYGAFLVRQGRAEEALPPLDQAVRAKPDSARAHIERGRALLEAGKPQPASTSLERALQLDPSAWAARLLLGRAYRELGRTVEAERELTLGKQGWARQNPGGVQHTR